MSWDEILHERSHHLYWLFHYKKHCWCRCIYRRDYPSSPLQSSHTPSAISPHILGCCFCRNPVDLSTLDGSQSELFRDAHHGSDLKRNGVVCNLMCLLLELAPWLWLVLNQHHSPILSSAISGYWNFTDENIHLWFTYSQERSIHHVFWWRIITHLYDKLNNYPMLFYDLCLQRTVSGFKFF